MSVDTVGLLAAWGVLVGIFVAMEMGMRRDRRRLDEALRQARLEYLRAVAAERARRMDGPPRPRLRVVRGGRA